MPVVYGGTGGGYYGGAGFIVDTITATTALRTAAGTKTAPSLTAGDATVGWYTRSSGTVWGFASTGTEQFSVTNNVFQIGNGIFIGFGSGDLSTTATDTFIGRDAANTIAQKNGATDQLFRKYGGNAGLVEWGSISENLTLSTGGTTTNTAANLLPANSYIEYVTARVTTTVATATSWQLGDATIAGRFTAAQSGAQLTSGATVVGMVHVDLTGTSGPRQTAASTLRVTTVGTPSAGAIRITSYYRTYTPATS